MRAATWEPIDPVRTPRARWVFLPQTLDTRRLPSYDYDTQELLTGGLRLADQNDGWNGRPDRFELEARRQARAAHRVQRATGSPTGACATRTSSRRTTSTPTSCATSATGCGWSRPRRVKHHKFYRRIFYVDEDTWQVAQEEIYDKEASLSASATTT